ncbi:hypothetical protein FKM82_020014, partial [Ascaphus truei]
CLAVQRLTPELSPVIDGESQPALTQPPSAEVTLGQDTLIPCSLNSGSSFDIYRVIWLQQRLGSGPRMVYHFRRGSTQGRGDGIPDRFSVTDDVPSRRWDLVIRGVQAEDEADYYCTT